MNVIETARQKVHELTLRGKNYVNFKSWLKDSKYELTALSLAAIGGATAAIYLPDYSRNNPLSQDSSAVAHRRVPFGSFDVRSMGGELIELQYKQGIDLEHPRDLFGHEDDVRRAAIRQIKLECPGTKIDASIPRLVVTNPVTLEAEIGQADLTNNNCLPELRVPNSQ